MAIRPPRRSRASRNGLGLTWKFSPTTWTRKSRPSAARACSAAKKTSGCLSNSQRWFQRIVGWPAGAVAVEPVPLQLGAVDAGVHHRALRPQLRLEAARAVVGHRLEEALDAAEELLLVEAGVEDERVRGERGREVREAEVHVRRLALRHGVGELALVEVDDLRQCRERRERPGQLGKAEHAAREQHVGLAEPLAHLREQREVAAAHPPLPEAPGEGERLDAVAREGGDLLREEAVRAAAEGLDEEDAQALAHARDCTSADEGAFCLRGPVAAHPHRLDCPHRSRRPWSGRPRSRATPPAMLPSAARGASSMRRAWNGVGMSAWQIAFQGRRARTCSRTRGTPSTGTRGARRPSPRRAAATCRSSSPSATRPATGATSWSARASRTRRSRG